MVGEKLPACAVTHQAHSWLFPHQSNPPKVQIFSRLPQEIAQSTSSIIFSKLMTEVTSTGAFQFIVALWSFYVFFAYSIKGKKHKQLINY